MIPCVVLASVPKVAPDSEAAKAFKKDYSDFVSGTIRTIPYEITLADSNLHDGGNGGGGEPGGTPLRPAISSLGKTFWEFRHKAAAPQGGGGGKEADWGSKYPENLRFELCLYFDDIGQATEWLAHHGAGQKLGNVFTFVEIVALSTPTFKKYASAT